MKTRLKEIKANHEFRKGEGWEFTTLTEDIDWLIEQAEKTEQYRESLKTIIKLTSCDDTWDFANRTLEGKQRIELPYRINKV